MAQDETNSRRSDQIRLRRAERVRRSVLPDSGQTPRTSPRRKQARTTGRTTRRMEASIPPVMVRNPSSRPAAVKRKGGKAKRRYDVVLGTTGAEMRLPSLPSVTVGWRLISFVLLGVIGFIAYQVWTSPKYRVSEVKVGGLQRITSREVSRALDVTDTQVFLLNPGQMEKDLRSSFPEFSSVDVTISLPASVVVTVTERIPVIAWNQEGHITLVDKDGIGFPLREGKDSPKLVVEALSAPPALVAIDPLAAMQAKEKDGQASDPLSSKPGAPFLTPQMVAEIRYLAQQVPAATQLVYERKHGLGWKEPAGWNVYFGDTGDSAMKMNVYQAIVKHLQAEEIQPTMISVEHVDAPYYRVDQ